jgi:hypothetical protein
LAGLIGAEYWRIFPIQFELLYDLRNLVFLVFERKEIQWALAVSFGFYIMLLLGAYLKRPETNPLEEISEKLLLLGVCGFGFFAYFSDYQNVSDDFLVFLGGILIHVTVYFFLNTKSELDRSNTAFSFIQALVLLLTLLSHFQPYLENGVFKYWGAIRWTGIWSNPNVFGLLMAVGLVLVITLIGEILISYRRIEISGAQFVGLGKLSSLLLYGVFGVLLINALINTHSRGAWVSAAIGVAYWLFSNIKAKRLIPEPRAWLNYSALVIALIVILHWQFRDTSQPLVRRFFSITNVNDFSWRNRVSSYDAGLQMWADNPLKGFGWNKPRFVYEELYMPFRLREGFALLTNDYFVLGTSLGILALACFLSYIYLKFAGCKNPIADVVYSSRAAALVLICGFFFDGGLFRMALSVPFWILLASAGPKK